MPNEVRSVEEAARLVAAARRILVVGCSGSGKSTLSRHLAARFGLEHLPLDREVYWLAGWNLRDKVQQRAILQELVGRENWIMDGSGASSLDIRLPRADLVIWLRLPRWLCLWGVARRVWRYYGSIRPEMAPGCPEPLPDREFLSYIWNFEKKQAPQFLQNFDLYGPDVPIFQIKSRRQTRRLLDLAEAED